MKCNRCGKEIEETEMFCNDCKKHLKDFSSNKRRKKVIEESNDINDLGNTKELVNLDKLEEVSQGIVTKNNKKKLILIISIAIIVLIGLIIGLVIFLKKDKPEEPKEVVIDYEKVINAYGKNIDDIIENYLETNTEIPSWQYILERITYDRYEVECSIHNIYKDGGIYLSGCKVDNKKIKYTYGVQKEEIKEGQKVNIYKLDYSGHIVYTGINEPLSILVGTITCKTLDCIYINAYDKYVLIEEENEYYLYDYTTDSLNFGPFKLSNEYDVLVYENVLYGIIYNQDNINNLYNVKTGKILKNIKGYLIQPEMNFDPTIMYKYNYAVLINNEINEFVNINTGNISYKIEESILSFIEKDNIVYIVTKTKNNKYKIYNSNGKALFEGKEYINFIIRENDFLVSTETNFKVYDKKLNLKLNSKIYDKILGLYQDFVVAVKDNNLMLLSVDDKEYVTFENVWNDYTNVFHYNLTTKTDDRISVIIEDKKTPVASGYMGIEYYYDINTKESGSIESRVIG